MSTPFKMKGITPLKHYTGDHKGVGKHPSHKLSDFSPKKLYKKANEATVNVLQKLVVDPINSISSYFEKNKAGKGAGKAAGKASKLAKRKKEWGY